MFDTTPWNSGARASKARLLRFPPQPDEDAAGPKSFGFLAFWPFGKAHWMGNDRYHSVPFLSHKEMIGNTGFVVDPFDLLWQDLAEPYSPAIRFVHCFSVPRECWMWRPCLSANLLEFCRMEGSRGFRHIEISEMAFGRWQMLSFLHILLTMRPASPCVALRSMFLWSNLYAERFAAKSGVDAELRSVGSWVAGWAGWHSWIAERYREEAGYFTKHPTARRRAQYGSLQYRIESGLPTLR